MHPWARGPFELLLHAEDHLRKNGDFDRRISLISFDNAVEVAVSTYLSLNPVLRGGRSYSAQDIDKWMDNYPGKLDFLEAELKQRKMVWKIPRNHIFWAHTHRNKQYHEGSGGTPEQHVLKVIREAALWVFGLLFDVVDVEKAIADELLALPRSGKPAPRDDYNKAIDNEHGLVTIGDYLYYASDILYLVDYDAYKAVGAKLCGGSDNGGAGS